MWYRTRKKWFVKKPFWSEIAKILVYDKRKRRRILEILFKHDHIVLLGRKKIWKIFPGEFDPKAPPSWIPTKGASLEHPFEEAEKYYTYGKFLEKEGVNIAKILGLTRAKLKEPLERYVYVSNLDPITVFRFFGRVPVIVQERKRGKKIKLSLKDMEKLWEKGYYVWHFDIIKKGDKLFFTGFDVPCQVKPEAKYSPAKELRPGVVRRFLKFI